MSQRVKGPRYYSTSKTASRFVSECMELLGDYGARSFHVLQEDRRPSAIAFVLDVRDGEVAFKLIPNIEAVADSIDSAIARGEISASDVANAEAVAWAQIRHLLELQLEIVRSGAVTPAQIFGGMALTSGNRTVAEMIEERVGELLPGEHPLLPSGR